MPETIETVQDTETNLEQADISTQLQAAIWEDKPITQPTITTETKVEEVKTEVKPEPTANEWWKDLEFQDADTAKSEIKRLKEVKQQEEIKFANDDSRKAFEYLKEGKEDELYAHLAKKKTVEKLLTGDVTESNAADIIKFSIKNKYTEYSDADVDRRFNKMFGVPKEPSIKSDELDEEFKVRHDEWKEKVEEMKADMLLEAKTIRPDLTKLKTELVLPDISNPNSPTLKQLTPEELAADKKVKEDWTKVATATTADFAGFTTTAKYKDGDKDVEIPVSYGLSEDEKKTLVSKLADFANNDFDPYTILKERWVNADGNDNINQVVKDLSWLMYGEKAAQKFATEAANQRLETYLKDKKNIRIDTGAGKDFGAGEDAKSQSEKLQEQFWGNN